MRALAEKIVAAAERYHGKTILSGVAVPDEDFRNGVPVDFVDVVERVLVTERALELRGKEKRV